jgi:heme-degrading monooxygenase HmoA
VHDLIAIDLFEVPPGGDDEFVAAWEAESDGVLYRALRSDVPFRYAVVGPDDAGLVVVHEDGEPDGAEGATLIEPFAVPPGEEDRFTAAWQRARAVLAGQRGYLGARLLRSGDPRADFRFIAMTRWSSPLMLQRATQSDAFGALAAMPFRSYPALYVVAASTSSG